MITKSCRFEVAATLSGKSDVLEKIQSGGAMVQGRCEKYPFEFGQAKTDTHYS